MPSGKAMGSAIADLGLSNNFRFNSIVKELAFNPDLTAEQLESIKTVLIYKNEPHPQSGLYMLGMQFVDSTGAVVVGHYKTSETPFEISIEDNIFQIQRISVYILWGKPDILKNRIEHQTQ